MFTQLKVHLITLYHLQPTLQLYMPGFEIVQALVVLCVLQRAWKCIFNCEFRSCGWQLYKQRHFSHRSQQPPTIDFIRYQSAPLHSGKQGSERDFISSSGLYGEGLSRRSLFQGELSSALHHPFAQSGSRDWATEPRGEWSWFIWECPCSGRSRYQENNKKITPPNTTVVILNPK